MKLAADMPVCFLAVVVAVVIFCCLLALNLAYLDLQNYNGGDGMA